MVLFDIGQSNMKKLGKNKGWERFFILPTPVYLVIVFSLQFLSYIYPVYSFVSYPKNLFGLIPLSIGVAIFLHVGIFMLKRKTGVTWATPNKLVDTGIFGISRNPMYIGFLFIILGTGIFSGNIISVLLTLVAFLVLDRIVIPFEEELMVTTFGHDYTQYKKKVRRWI